MATRYVWGRYQRNSTTTTTYHWNRYKLATTEKTSTITSFPFPTGSIAYVADGYTTSGNNYVLTGDVRDFDYDGTADYDYYQKHMDSRDFPYLIVGSDTGATMYESNHIRLYWWSIGNYLQVRYDDGTSDGRVGTDGRRYEITKHSFERTQGSSAGSVTSTSRSAYPDNGISGNYWYVYSRSSTSTTYSRGNYIDDVSSDSSNAYPENSHSGSYWYTSKGQDNIDPISVSYDSEQVLTQQMVIQAAASTGNVYGGTITYDYQVCVDGSSWIDVGSSTALSMNYTTPETATQFQARVRAKDNMGFTSTTWVTGPLATVRPPWTNTRLHRMNGKGTYDLVHFMTGAENVVHNGTNNVQAVIDNIKQRLGLS